jgi:hypothetical protein
MIQVKQEVINQIKKSPKAKGRLAYEFGRTTKTIDMWLDENDIMLTTAMGVRAIAEELELKESQILNK